MTPRPTLSSALGPLDPEPHRPWGRFDPARAWLDELLFRLFSPVHALRMASRRQPGGFPGFADQPPSDR